MKICFVNSNFQIGGVQKVTIDIANKLSKDFDVSIISFAKETPFYSINETVKFMSISNFFVSKILLKCDREFRKKMFGKFSIRRNFKYEIDKLIEFLKDQKIEILIMCQGAFTALIPEVQKKLPKIKCIAWQHSEAKVYFQNYNKHYLDEYIEGLQKANNVVCLTKKDLEVFRQYNKNCIQFYNPVDLSVTKKSSLSNKNICFAGRIVMDSKGIGIILETLPKIDENWKLLIAGTGSKNEIDKMKKKIEELSIQDRIEFMGPIRSTEMPYFYSKADIYVSASKWEGFGLTLIESMSCGLAVIAFDNSGPKEILEDGKFGVLVRDRNSDCLAYEINELILKKDKLKFYQDKSLIRAEDFSMEKIANQWKDVFEKL